MFRISLRRRENNIPERGERIFRHLVQGEVLDTSAMQEAYDVGTEMSVYVL